LGRFIMSLGRYTTRACGQKEHHHRAPERAVPGPRRASDQKLEQVQGATADMVVYDLERLKVMPMEIAHDFPGGEWRRVQRAEGYRAVVLNGEITFEDGRETGALSGPLLRQGV
jgi:hypothetical protein